ncbi:MAG: cytochrome P450 [Sulfitobacter sp.]
MSMSDLAEPDIKARPVFPISDTKFRTLGMIKVAQKAVSAHGQVVTLAFEGDRKSTLLVAPRHTAFWRKNGHLFHKDIVNPQTGVSAARDVLGKNLLTAGDTDEWAMMRKDTLRVINTSKPWFDRSLRSATKELIEGLRTQQQTPVLDHCVAWSVRMTSDALLGTDTLDQDAEDLVQSLNRAFLDMGTPNADAASQEAKARAADLLNQARAKHGPDSIAALAHGTDQFDSHVIGLLAASLHINALVLFWALIQLADNPDVQGRLHDEANPLGDVTRRLSNAPYAYATLQETQRLRPAMAFIERQVRERFTLDGYTFEAGETVLFSPWFAQRDEAAWPDALAFDPSRFQTPADIIDGSFFPFGTGPRMCPGSPIVNQQVAYAISMTAKALTLQPNPETRPGDLAPLFQINLEPRGPVYLLATPNPV